CEQVRGAIQNLAALVRGQGVAYERRMGGIHSARDLCPRRSLHFCEHIAAVLVQHRHCAGLAPHPFSANEHSTAQAGVGQLCYFHCHRLIASLSEYGGSISVRTRAWIILFSAWVYK